MSVRTDDEAYDLDAGLAPDRRATTSVPSRLTSVPTSKPTAQPTTSKLMCACFDTCTWRTDVHAHGHAHDVHTHVTAYDAHSHAHCPADDIRPHVAAHGHAPCIARTMQAQSTHYAYTTYEPCTHNA